MHADVRDGRGREVLLQRLPLPAVVERHEEAELGAGVSRPSRSDPRGRRAWGDRWECRCRRRSASPGRAVVVGLVDVRLQVVVAQEAIHRDVRRALAMRRGLDVLDAPDRRQVLRRTSSTSCRCRATRGLDRRSRRPRARRARASTRPSRRSTSRLPRPSRRA